MFARLRARWRRLLGHTIPPLVLAAVGVVAALIGYPDIALRMVGAALALLGLTATVMGAMVALRDRWPGDYE